MELYRHIFQRIHKNGQQVHGNVFKITKYAKQGHNEISPHTCQNGYCQKDKKIINIA